MYNISDLITDDALIASEANVLGIILKDRGVLRSSILKAEHFSTLKHKELFNTILESDKRGEKFDYSTIYGDLLQSGKSELVGGFEYLSKLVDSIPTTADFKFHESKVIKAFQRRQGAEILKSFMENDLSLEDTILGMKSLNTIITNDLPDLNSAIDDAWMALMDEAQGIPTGYHEYDRLTKGLHAGDLIIIGARPSMGKTAFVLNLINNITKSDANKEGCVSGVFSLEMPASQLIYRLASMNGRVPLIKFREALNAFNQDDWSKANLAMQYAKSLDMRIFDKAGVTVADIWRQTEMLRSYYGKDRQMVIVIDYLQLIRSNAKSSRNEQVSEISQTLKIMAREFNCTVIALSQLNRSVEQRENKRPVMSDIRDSGSIEQDADVIGFLYRDDYYNPDSDAQNIVELNITKQRNGPLGTVQLYFAKEYTQMLSLSVRDGEGE